MVFGIAVNQDKDKDGKVKEFIINTTKEIFNDAKIVLMTLDEQDEERLDNIDIYVVLGGDGTILAAARRLHGKKIPILGVNIGHLGFLAAVEVSSYKNALELIKDKKYSIEKRTMIKASFIINGKEVKYIAMNDIVITKGSLGRILKYDVEIDKNYATSFRGDGLIFSTPTGSTAYNLSAGGPIVYPTVKAISMTAICPHTIGLRNFIINSSSKVQVSVIGDVDSYYISIDGQENFNLPINTKINITESQYYAQILRLDNYDYFDVLRKKIVNKAQDI